MSTPAATEIPPLTGEVVSFIGDPSATLVLARIERLDFAITQHDDLTVEAGHVILSVVESLANGSPGAGETIRVPARRVADPIIRGRNAFDQWNALPLERNDLLIVAVRPAGPDSYVALAVRQVSSVSDPKIDAIRQAYAIERFTGPADAREARFAAALTGPQDLLNEYALDALQRRALLGRDTGARLMAAAVLVNGAGDERQHSVAEALTELMESERRTDGTNLLIVRTIAQALAAEPDPDRGELWTMYLGAVLLTEFATDPLMDAQWRNALIQKVDSPAPGEMIAILSDLVRRDAENEQARALLRAWQRAYPGR